VSRIITATFPAPHLGEFICVVAIPDDSSGNTSIYFPLPTRASTNVKVRKLTVFIDISFKPNEDLEKKINATLKRPFKFGGSGQSLGKNPQRDVTYTATVPYTRVTDMRRMAFILRRWKGVKSVGFSVLEEVPLTKGPLALSER
jgi:hypothetical protein